MSESRTTPDIADLTREAQAAGRLPRVRGALYVAEHVVRAMRAYGWTILVNAVGQPVLYLLGLVLGLAALIAQPISDGAGQQVSYVVFVAPALLMASAVQIASQEFSYPIMDGFKWRRFFFGFSASPISPGQISVGMTLGGLARVLVAAVAYYVFIWVFQAVPDPATGWLTVPISLLAALAFGAPLMAYAASLEDDRGQFAMVQRFIFMPMFLFSGTFYPLENLPIWLQWIGWISPLWHSTQLGRVATYGMTEPLWLSAVHLIFLVVFAAGGLILSRRMFIRRLAK